MAEQDLYMKNLLKDKPRFADLFNAEVFEGNQVLRADDLTPMAGESGIVVIDQKGAKRVLERRRDVVMKAVGGICYVLMAVENQESLHFAMPVRSMVYDSLDYVEQLERLAKEHRENGDRLIGNEFLSKITKEDRITPVVPLVLYSGKEPWSGPVSLYDMMGIDGKWEGAGYIKKFLPDYRINLVDMRRTENLEYYRTSLQQIFSMLKYNQDKEKLYQYTRDHRQELRQMDSDSMAALLTLMGEQKRISKILEDKNGKEEIDMCDAIDALIEDGKREGIALGKEAGQEEGLLRGQRRMAELTRILLENNQADLLLQATKNDQIRDQLFEQYHI